MDSSDHRPSASDDSSAGSTAPETGDESPGTDDERGLLGWPPPGLGRLQGDLWEVTKQGALGGVLLVLPLLWSVASEQDFSSLGPFGGSWWIVLVTSFLGLAVLVSAFVGLFRIFRRAGRATNQGYGWRTVAVVAADARRDAGFLLQGARAYSVLSAGQRRTLVLCRLVAVASYVAAVFWLPVGFIFGVLLAARGVVAPSGLSLFTLAPAALLLLAGLLVRMWDTRTVRKARKEWFAQPWSRDLARDDVYQWNDDFEERREEEIPGPGGRGGGGRFRLAGGVVLGLGIVVLIPSLTMLFSTAMGPVLASLAAPEFAATQRKAAAVEAYRRYVVEKDSAVTPQDAGRIAHSLSFTGSDREAQELEQEPATRFREDWIPDVRGGPTGVFPGRWSEELMPRAVAGELSAEERSFLREVSEHPGHDAVARMARAPALDVVGTRWVAPLPPGASWVQLPIPKLSPLREASWAVVGAAALDADRGRTGRAEERLRSLISAGFLLGDDGPTLLDNLIGYVLVSTGGEALEALLDGTGRDQEADALRWARRTSDRTAELVEIGTERDLEAALRQIPEIVEDPAAIRGLRWEYFAFMNTLAPCLNLQKVVFGPGESYREWVDRSRSGLVRFASEEALFERLRGGWFGTEAAREGGPVGGILQLTLGGRGVTGSCATLVQNLEGIGAL